MTNWVKIGAAAAQLGLTDRQLRTLDKKGLIKTIRTEGRTRLFDVDGYIAKLEADKTKEVVSGLIGEKSQEKSGQTNETESDKDVVPTTQTATATQHVDDPWKADIEAVFKAVSESAGDGNKFPIDFENAYKWIGFTEKGSAKKHLVKHFDQGTDFQFLTRKSKTQISGELTDTVIGRPSENIHLTVDCFKSMCMTVCTEQSKRVRRYFLDLEERWRKGDLQLAGEIVQNYDRIHGTKTNVLLHTTDANSLPQWVPEWRDARTNQMDRGKTLRDALKEMNLSDPAIYAIIENMHNQGVLGFGGTTKQWRRENGIPENKPLAEVMDKTQLDLRRMMSIKLMELYSQVDQPSRAEIIRVTKGVQQKIADMSEYMGLNEYRPKVDEEGNDVYIGKRVRQLEALQRRSAKRLKTLERKQALLESVPVAAVTASDSGQRCIGDFFK